MKSFRDVLRDSFPRWLRPALTTMFARSTTMPTGISTKRLSNLASVPSFSPSWEDNLHNTIQSIYAKNAAGSNTFTPISFGNSFSRTLSPTIPSDVRAVGSRSDTTVNPYQETAPSETSDNMFPPDAENISSPRPHYYYTTPPRPKQAALNTTVQESVDRFDISPDRPKSLAGAFMPGLPSVGRAFGMPLVRAGADRGSKGAMNPRAAVASSQTENNNDLGKLPLLRGSGRMIKTSADAHLAFQLKSVPAPRYTLDASTSDQTPTKYGVLQLATNPHHLSTLEAITEMNEAADDRSAGAQLSAQGRSIPSAGTATLAERLLPGALSRMPIRVPANKEIPSVASIGKRPETLGISFSQLEAAEKGEQGSRQTVNLPMQRSDRVDRRFPSA
jgi:hypothetical protein